MATEEPGTPPEIPQDYDERGAEIERLRAQLAAAEAASTEQQPPTRRTAPASTTSAGPEAGRIFLHDGDECPRCGEGVLALIGRRDDSLTFQCFMCNTRGSVNPDVGHQLVTESPLQTPTGFTLSPAQAAARGATDPEEAAAENLTAEAGSGTTAPQRSVQHG